MTEGNLQQLILDGRIVAGRCAASRALALQLPYFIGLLPDLVDYYPATLNIELDHGVYVREWDLHTPPIYWYQPNPTFAEKFSFMRVTLTYNGGLRCRAMLYHPHKSPHRDNPFLVELIAPRLDLQRGDCQVIFPRAAQRDALFTI